MIPKLFTVVSFLLGLSSAQTPPNFQPSTDVNLSIYFGSTKITPGQAISLSIPRQAPTISLPASLSANGTYLLNMVDPDAPSPENPSPSLAQVLHWLQQDVKFTDPNKATFGSAAVDPYFAPAPPSVSKHRYIFLLYRQDKKFAWPPGWEGYGRPNNGNRTAFDANKFSQAAGLGAPVAATWFLVGAGS